MAGSPTLHSLVTLVTQREVHELLAMVHITCGGM